MDPRGATYAALAAMLYGSAYVATAIALESFGPVAIAVWRGLAGAVVLALVLVLPAAAGLRPRPLTRVAWLRVALLGLVGGGVFVLAMNAAVAAAGATVTAFVAGLYAVLGALFAVPLLGERLELRTLGALLVALAGTALLAELEAGGEAVVGVLIGLVAAVAFGLFLVLTRRWSVRYALRGATVGLSVLSASAIVALLVLPLTAAPLFPRDPSAPALVAVGWLAVGPSAGSAVFVVLGVQRLAARHTSAFLLLNPPTAAILAILLLGETLSVVQLIGAALVLVAISAAALVPAFRR